MTTTKDNATLAALCRCLPYVEQRAADLRRLAIRAASDRYAPAAVAAALGRKAEDAENAVSAARLAIREAALAD